MARKINADKAAKDAAKLAIAEQAAVYKKVSDELAAQNLQCEIASENCNIKRYEVVAGIMQLFESIKADADSTAVAKQLRSEIKATQDVTMQADSKLELVTARLVIRGKQGDDKSLAAARKTAHLYARVIEAATANNVTSAELVSFIKQQGGLNKVNDLHFKKQTTNNNAEVLASTASAVRNTLHERTALAKFALNAGSEELVTDKKALAGDLVYFVCKFENNLYNVLDAVVVEAAAEQRLLAKLVNTTEQVAANNAHVHIAA
jgi:hypothetical protein